MNSILHFKHNAEDYYYMSRLLCQNSVSEFEIFENSKVYIENELLEHVQKKADRC